MATGSFALKRLDFKIGEGDWADTSVVANDVQVKFKLQIAGLNTTDVNEFADTQIASFASTQIAALTVTNFSALDATQVGGLTTTQIAGLSTTLLRGLNATAPRATTWPGGPTRGRRRWRGWRSRHR